MTQWYVKDLSKLTEVSVQTLHHYDRIGLLEPSVRLANGYRLYSEKDLLKLQQIIALKFFGFELSQIKILLASEVDVLAHFSAQSRSLEEKARTLLQASHTLNSIISDSNHNKSIPWETIIKLIEVYRMAEKLENKWATKVFSPEELKEYVHFEQEVKKRFSDSEMKIFQNGWDTLIKEVDANLNKDPTSDFGMDIGNRCMALVNNYYGAKHVKLRNLVWDKGIKTGRATKEDKSTTISTEGAAWLDKAISAYYKDRIYKILKQVGVKSNDDVLKLWEDVLADMYGEDQSGREEILDAVRNDATITPAAKKWVEQISK